MTDRPDNAGTNGNGYVMAAEYALGVLSGEDRRAAERRIRNDPEFARAVAAWEDRLNPLAASIPAAQPPPGVWADIERKVFAPPARQSTGLWTSLGFWRALAMAGVAAVVLLIAYPQLSRPPAPVAPEELVVTLRSAERPERFVATHDKSRAMLTVTALSPLPRQNADFELWLIEGGNAPVSLGVIQASASSRISLGPQLNARFSEGVTLAVSLEPAGGSATGAPTGPVIAAGQASRL